MGADPRGGHGSSTRRGGHCLRRRSGRRGSGGRAMKGKWAKGIPPRFFAWIIKGRLAVSERPGGYARNHRKVRRHEEILWLRGEGFTRIVSLLPSPHNLHAYDELNMTWSHIPFGPH